MHEPLRRALTFHAPFADSPDGTFDGGDRTRYTIGEDGALTPGLGRLAIDRARGGLRFSRESSAVVGFHARGNISYAADSFQGPVILSMSLDPGAIPSRYCDPLQITDKKYSGSCIWRDFTKNDDPPDLRLGIFGERGGWDATGKESDSQEFYFRLFKIALPPIRRQSLDPGRHRVGWSQHRKR